VGDPDRRISGRQVRVVIHYGNQPDTVGKLLTSLHSEVTSTGPRKARHGFTPQKPSYFRHESASSFAFRVRICCMYRAFLVLTKLNT
jgi:hypothetical protein